MKFKVKKDVIIKEVFAIFSKYCRNTQRYIWWEKVSKKYSLAKADGFYIHWYLEIEKGEK